MLLFKLCLFCLFFSRALLALTLREQFQTSCPGDYIVWQQERSLLLFVIESRDSNQLILHEISLPKSAGGYAGTRQWQGWLDRKAPGATAWVRYTVNLSTGVLEQAWCCLRGCYLDVKKMQGMLHSLLLLQLERIPKEERKRIPGAEAVGIPALWQPPLVFNGERINQAEFEGWRAWWPQDGSSLAGLRIELFLPTHFKEAPAYLPYWMQASGKVVVVKVRAIDSGRSLIIPS